MKTYIEQIAANPKEMKAFQRARLELEITELACELMEQQGMSRATLARRMGCSRARITQLFSDGSNMTVETIADLFLALGRTARVIDRPLSVMAPKLLVGEINPRPRYETPKSAAPEIVLPTSVFKRGLELGYGLPGNFQSRQG